jgi:hypothetical protein
MWTYIIIGLIVLGIIIAFVVWAVCAIGGQAEGYGYTDEPDKQE